MRAVQAAGVDVYKEVVKEGVVVELHEDEPRAAARQAPERVCVRARACVL